MSHVVASPNGAKHPSWGSKLENRGVVGNLYKKHGFWTFLGAFGGSHHSASLDSNSSWKMLQIGGGNASKFEVLMLSILPWSSGCRHFWSKNWRKWKVTESFKTYSWDVLRARRLFLSDFRARKCVLNNVWKVAFFRILSDFWVGTRMLETVTVSIEGCFAPLLCKEHRGLNV